MVNFRESVQIVGISFYSHATDSFALICLQSVGRLVQKFTTPESRRHLYPDRSCEFI